MNRIGIFPVLATLIGLAPLPVAEADQPQPSAEQLQFFEAKIRPALIQHCYACHSRDAEKGIKGGLTVDTREGMLQGGDSGPALVPGKPEESLLIEGLHYDDFGLQMPPKGKLPANVIADFEQWVRMGAPDPREGKPASKSTTQSMTIEEARRFWSFQPPRKSDPPAVQNASWAWSDIDRFLLADLEAKGLTPVGDADRHTLIRRVTFDLTGLPPTPEDVRAFVADPSPTSQALKRVVDRLLASPRFGERWGRHWLDVARYAESSGKEQNMLYPFAWRYRDYVIAALNADKPYDQFLREQIAGDLLPADRDDEKAEHLIATGYLAVGPKSHNTPNPRQFRLDLADEQIDALSQGMLGLTIACARCHDHKFDPISQKDYYSLVGIFLSTDTRYGTAQAIQNRQAAELVRLPGAAKVVQAPALTKQALQALRERLENLKTTRQNLLSEAREKRDPSILQGNIRFLVLNTQISQLEKRLTYYDEDGTAKALAMGVQDRYYFFDSPLLIRGELDKPGDVVPRGVIDWLCGWESEPIDSGSGRLELAEWITSPSNPLTARVMANRLWLHLFGRGLVATPDNFGTTGQPPSHPALLDWLATTFVEDGWSVKALIRRIVTSRAYQLASTHDATNAAVDPDNTLIWRMSPRRLEAEAIRDAILAVSGELETTPPVASPIAQAGDGPANLVRLTPGGGALVIQPGPVPDTAGAGLSKGQAPALAPGQGLRKGQFPGLGQGPGLAALRRGQGGALPQPPSDPTCRSVYLPVIRDQVSDVLAAFDFAETSLVVGQRETTTVPSQALFMMNSPFVLRQSFAMADRLLSEAKTPPERIRLAFELTFARGPSADELKAARDFFRDFPADAVKRDGSPGPGRLGAGPFRRGAGADPAVALAGPLPPLVDRERTMWTAFCQSLFASAEFRYLN